MEALKNFCLLLLLGLEATGHRSRRVYNGASDSNVPYYVRLLELDKRIFFCGGVIIAKDWIVTAAHCFNNRELHKVKVITSDKRKSFKGNFHSIENFIKHENFEYLYVKHDIGLIKLSESLEFSDSQDLIRIRSTPLGSNEFLKFSGMGRVNTSAGSFPAVIQSSVIPVIDSETCQNEYYPLEKYYKLTENMFCAGSNESHPCIGDSGGPLVDFNSSKRAKLVGIDSYGPKDGCGNHIPRIFTNVINYRGWIQNKTNFALDYFTSNAYYLLNIFNYTNNKLDAFFKL